MNKEKLTKFHQDNILEVAEKLFVERGFDGTSMEVIAKNAELSKATIYVYFRSKAEIFANLLIEKMKQLEEIFQKNMQGVGFVEAYYAFCNSVSDFQKDNALIFDGLVGKVAYDSKNEIPKEIQAELLQEMLRVNGHLYKLCDKGIAEGHILSDVDKQKAVLFAWATITETVRMRTKTLKTFLGENAEQEQYYKFVCDSILKMLTQKL